MNRIVFCLLRNQMLIKRKKTTKALQKTGSLVDMKKLDSREFEKWITKEN